MDIGDDGAGSSEEVRHRSPRKCEVVGDVAGDCITTKNLMGNREVE